MTVSRVPVIGTIEMIVGLVDKNNDNDADGGGSVVILHIFASIIVSFNLSISG